MYSAVREKQMTKKTTVLQNKRGEINRVIIYIRKSPMGIEKNTIAIAVLKSARR